MKFFVQTQKKLSSIKKTKWKYIKYIFFILLHKLWFFVDPMKIKNKTIFFDNNRKQKLRKSFGKN